MNPWKSKTEIEFEHKLITNFCQDDTHRPREREATIDDVAAWYRAQTPEDQKAVLDAIEIPRSSLQESLVRLLKLTDCKDKELFSHVEDIVKDKELLSHVEDIVNDIETLVKRDATLASLLDIDAQIRRLTNCPNEHNVIEYVAKAVANAAFFAESLIKTREAAGCPSGDDLVEHVAKLKAWKARGEQAEADRAQWEERASTYARERNEAKAALKRESEAKNQLRVQLSACGVAAQGGMKDDDCKEGTCGWSASLCDVKNLWECNKNAQVLNAEYARRISELEELLKHKAPCDPTQEELEQLRAQVAESDKMRVDSVALSESRDRWKSEAEKFDRLGGEVARERDTWKEGCIQHMNQLEICYGAATGNDRGCQVGDALWSPALQEVRRLREAYAQQSKSAEEAKKKNAATESLVATLRSLVDRHEADLTVWINRAAKAEKELLQYTISKHEPLATHDLRVREAAGCPPQRGIIEYIQSMRAELEDSYTRLCGTPEVCPMCRYTSGPIGPRGPTGEPERKP